MRKGYEKPGHKWIKRIPTPSGVYKYIYNKLDVNKDKKINKGDLDTYIRRQEIKKKVLDVQKYGRVLTDKERRKREKEQKEHQKYVAAAVRALANNNEELGKKMLLHLRVAKTYEDSLNAKKKKTKDKLQHSGIMGMKWGVRRWQYEDGSLTPAGYEHYGVKKARKIDAKHYTKELNKRSKKGKDSTALIKKLEDKGYDVNSRIKVSSYSREKARKKAAVAATTAVSAVGTLAAGPAVGIPAGVAAGIGTMAVTSRKPYTKYKVIPNDQKMDEKRWEKVANDYKKNADKYYEDAVKKDQWDMEFLESYDTGDLNRKQLLSEYKKYLRNGGYAGKRA